jgi:hypothetical protein
MSGQPTNGTSATHLSERQIEAYQRRSLAGGALLDADGHLGECSSCRRLLLSRMKSIALPEEVLTMSEPLHLSYEQISAYVDGKLTGTEHQHVEAHKFICKSCDREIMDMVRLEQQLAIAPAKVHVVEHASLRERIAQFFAPPGRVREFGLAFGAIIAGVFVILHADRTPGAGTMGSGEAARLIHFGSSAHPGMDLGGFLLVAIGLGYLGYSVWKKRS